MIHKTAIYLGSVLFLTFAIGSRGQELGISERDLSLNAVLR